MIRSDPGPVPQGNVAQTRARSHELYRLADELDLAAEHIAAQAAALGPQHYEGPAAERFRAAMQQERAALRSEAGRLRTVAAVLARAAGDLEREQRAWRLRRVQFDRQQAQAAARR
jgi:hypothetical protein